MGFGCPMFHRDKGGGEGESTKVMVALRCRWGSGVGVDSLGERERVRE